MFYTAFDIINLCENIVELYILIEKMRAKGTRVKEGV